MMAAPVEGRQVWLAALAIVVLAVVAYAPVFANGTIWDDDDYVTENTALDAPDGLRRIWFGFRWQEGERTGLRIETPQYYPLVFSSFYVEHSLWGDAPRGYHVDNVLLHATAAVLVMLLLLRLAAPPVAAFLAGALFAVHPVTVESVAWIAERKNVLSGVFYLAALLAWLRFSERRTGRAWALCFVLFVCALLSKTVTATFPVIVLLLEWARGRPITRRLCLALVPFFVLGAASGLFTAHIEAVHVGAGGVDWGFSLIERSLIATRATCFYLGKALWPVNLSFIYERWEVDSSELAQYGFAALLLVLAAVAWAARSRAGRWPIFFLASFVVTLGPALGFVDFYPQLFSFVADHFQYLALLAVCVPIALVVARLRVPALVALTSLALLGSLAMLTWQRTHAFRDEETLWADTIANNPRDFMGHSNLGYRLIERGELAEAAGHFEAAIRNNPEYHLAYMNLAGVRLLEAERLADDGSAAQRRRREELLAEAERLARDSVRVEPRFPRGWNVLGEALLRQGRAREAEDAWKEASRSSAVYGESRANLVRLCEAEDRLAEAVRWAQEWVAATPHQGLAHLKLAELQRRTRDDRGARATLEALLLDSPDEVSVLTALARVLATSQDAEVRDGARAMALAEKAVRLQSGPQMGPRIALAAASAECGDFERAVSVMQELLTAANESERPAIERLIARFRAREPLRE